MPMGGREYNQAQQMQATVTHKLRSVYFSGANPRMRLTAGQNSAEPDRVFNVASVINVEEKNRHLEWMCEESV
jgi:head-tail adaptor